MPTFTALTTLTGRDPAYALSEALDALDPAPMGVGVFEVEDGSGLWEVGAYFTQQPDQAGLAILSTLHDARGFAVSELPDQDWVAKVQRELPPVPAGRFHLFGSHDADSVPDDKIGILIDAAMAFGTGHHGTTLGCLLAFDTLLAGGVCPQNVADIGCGTAVLAIAAAKSTPQPVIASDIDPQAVEVAQANAWANGVGDRVHCVAAAGFDAADLRDRAPYDLVFANILKPPLIALAPDIAGAIARGGHAILSGILNEQADEVIAVYLPLGFDLSARDQLGEWTTLTLLRQ